MEMEAAVCQITTTSTFKDILDKIRDLPQPVGILIFGPDPQSVLEAEATLQMELTDFKPIITTLSELDAASHQERHNAIVAMKTQNNAAALVAVHIGTNKPLRSYNANMARARLKIGAPPTPDGLDCLISISTS